MLIFLSPRSVEGRLLEAILKAERGAALAGVVRSHALGRSRDPTGGHYDPSARSSLDRAVSGLGYGPKRVQVWNLRAETPPKDETWTWKRGPGIGNRRGGAPRGDAPCAQGARALSAEARKGEGGRKVRTDKWRLSAPRPPLFFRGRLPRAPVSGCGEILSKTRALAAPRE